MYLADEMSDDIMDHLLYSNTGYLCKKMLEKAYVKNCDACRKAFSSCPENSIFPLSHLIEIKTQGKLIYPNLKLFQIIKTLDKMFMVKFGMKEKLRRCYFHFHAMDIKLMFRLQSSTIIHLYVGIS